MNLYKYVKAHKELNPKLWNGFELKPEVEEKINDIINEFVDFVKKSGLEIEVIDTFLVGSNTGFNYNETSDIDVHLQVLLDISNYSKKDLLNLYLQYCKLFNMNFEPMIKNISVEIYVEDYFFCIGCGGDCRCP